ncbi:hypothetical protein C1H46_009100 [Malus baccata]|uniref:Uncharacterized protein n=1 Tax=Malus baccata TaxID=106549 RepID=A0A540N2R1_MALBA|nr:hypothetical protein C1H46_009100 [Malus baccata]
MLDLPQGQVYCSFSQRIREWNLDLVTISSFGAFGEEIWIWCAPSCRFGTFVLLCLGRFHHLVVFSSVAASVAVGKIFVAVTGTNTAIGD